MGLIADELSCCPNENAAIYQWLWSGSCNVSFGLVSKVCREMRLPASGLGATADAREHRRLPDAISEAIEAAEALGL